MAGYIGVGGKAQRVNALYVGVDGTARRVVKAYVGDENGKARLWWELGTISFTLLIPESSPPTEEKNPMVCQALDGMTWYEWFLSEYPPVRFEFLLPPNQRDMGVLQYPTGSGVLGYLPYPPLETPIRPTNGATYDLSRGDDPAWWKPVSDEGGGA